MSVVGGVIVVGGLAVNAFGEDDTKTAPHGSATMEIQGEELDKLIGDRAIDAVPAGVDKVLWDASIPDDNKMNKERVALGRKLYFDPALSADGTVACATCHDVTRSFTDRRGVSEGLALGRRNAPTTMNAALLHSQFWDGRNATLEAQAGQPILNPVEMGMPDRDTAVAAIKKNPDYAPMFKAAYGRDINYADIERAIAAFERTLIFLDAPLDRYLAGDESAISDDAKKGWELFNGKARCVSCHPVGATTPLGTDNRFHNIGVSARNQNFEELAKKALTALDKDSSEQKLDELAVATDMSELGRFMVTRNYADIGSFRTPQLRNTAITAPYMHDGSLQTLWDVMDHYNRGGEDNLYLDGGIEALNLSEAEIDQLVALMFTFTDDRFADLNKSEMARQKAHAAKNRPFREPARVKRDVLGFEKRVLESEKNGEDESPKGGEK